MFRSYNGHGDEEKEQKTKMFTNKCRNECYKSYLGITQILRNKYKKAVDPSHVNEVPSMFLVLLDL